MGKMSVFCVPTVFVFAVATTLCDMLHNTPCLVTLEFIGAIEIKLSITLMFANLFGCQQHIKSRFLS